MLLVQAPKLGAAEILQQRFPVPRLVDCDQNGSQVWAPMPDQAAASSPAAGFHMWAAAHSGTAAPWHEQHTLRPASCCVAHVSRVPHRAVPMLPGSPARSHGSLSGPPAGVRFPKTLNPCFMPRRRASCWRG